MNLRSTPQLTPSVTVNSPGSPPRTTTRSRSGSISPERLLGTITPGKIPDFNTELAQRSLLPSLQQLAVSSPDVQSQDPSKVSGVGVSHQFPPRTSSIPPVVNRAEKPKISSKSRATQDHESRRLTPEPTELPEKRVSPFSTPPSSEGSPSPERQGFAVRRPSLDSTRPNLEAQANGAPSETLPSQSTQPRRDSRLLGFSGPAGSIEPRDPRALGFSTNAVPSISRDLESQPTRANTVSERYSQRNVGARDTYDPFSSQKPTQRHVSEQVRTVPPQSIPKIPASGTGAVQRDARLYGFSKASSNGPRVEGPTRRAPPLPPLEEPKMLPNNRGSILAPQPVDRSTKPAPQTRKTSIPSMAINSDFPPPPRRNTFEDITSPVPGSAKKNAGNAHAPKPAQRQFFEDSDEAEEYEQDLPTTRSEYPDSSQANRRPPHFDRGAQEIPTKFDSRVFDVCGQYVCTTGYVTRVWDLSRGEQIFSLSHGETVKMISVAFKPGESLQNEGTRLWLGSNIGELHEIDVPTQAIVATSAVHNRREVIRILRHSKDLWTLDDEGKLFVWCAEELRMPSLKYSQYAHRVPKGHSFSMTVQDMLWYATGREISVFRPGDDASFSVFQKPLCQPGTGDVTSGTYTSRQGLRVYLGHADGKVSIYNAKDYACVGVIKASDYKINAMSFVGENLWTAYKTGKIYVYNTSCMPWKVKKDWRAHDGPTASMLLDPSSVWTLNRLQVASLGHDNCIRLWDGMLEEDWLEAEMQSNDVKYCTFREIRAAVVTWNVGACNPLDIRSDFISDAIHVEDPPELLIFGFQEIVDLEDRAVTAKSIFGFGKKKDKENARSEHHVSRVYREWRDYLGKCINRYTNPQYSYTEVHTSCLIGLFQCIFVRQEEKRNIRSMSAAEVKCGMKGHYGNKGALITRFMFDDSSMCFINCHLAAGQTQTSHRNNDIATILEAESLPPERNPNTRTSHYIGGGDGTQILDHEICILNGDLNYRIDAIPRDTVINMINKGELEKLLERDQIMVSRRRVSGFRLSPFNEAPITFAPTYKYDVGSDRYDSSEKKRSPAWCDRLLYRGVGRIKQVEYRRHEIRVSDHRPVSGTFKIRVKTIDAAKQDQMRDQCHKLFGDVQRRLTAEAR
jgi:WD40 repeat protein